MAFAFDEATAVIKIGKEMPIVGFHNGKVVWAKQGEVQMANLKLLSPEAADELKDGEKVSGVGTKDLGHSEVYAQVVKVSPNGRFFALCSDTDFVVY